MNTLSISRRGFIRAGAVSFGGMGLANLLRSEAAAGVSAAADKRSVIMLWQPGGPSHLDMWDMKPDAPLEYRGEFSSIPSDIPGYRVSELMPRLSQMCNKLVAKGVEQFSTAWVCQSLEHFVYLLHWHVLALE